MSFLTVCLNPTLQKTLNFSSVVPGAVNRAAAHRLDVSGKGINVTRVLTQLGKKATHLTQLGGDMRPLFLSLCEQDGLSVEWVESGSQIRFCYTLLTGNDGYVTELVEESEPVSAETEKLLLDKFDTLHPFSTAFPQANPVKNTVAATFLVVSGTKAVGFSDLVIPNMVRKAKEKGVRVILDIRGDDLINCLKFEPDIIKPNLDEFIATFKTEPTKDFLIDLAQKYRCSIILTNGSRKILAVSGDNYFEVEVKPVKVLNSIGCGDAFTAGLTSALSDGAGLHEAINEGKRCGALNAAFLKPGVIR